MILKFADYLVTNGYSPEDITILSLYNGQLSEIEQKIKSYKKLNNGTFKVEVKTVDNYQGEENKIILLSLVRSNPYGNIGFLKISNRICVALSRARNGLYIFGNAKCLHISSIKEQKKNRLKKNQEKQEITPLWIRILQMMKNNKSISDSLPLKCMSYENIFYVKTKEDFEKHSHGGCMEPCETRMKCGHACQLKCHPINKTLKDPTGHNHIKCEKT